MKQKEKLQNYKQTLTLMCGIPSCGKSYWIQKNKKDAVIVSPDGIRKNIFGHQFFTNAEDFIWAFAKGMCRLLIEQGKDVIIDATNLTFRSRLDWIRLAKQYGVKVKIVWIKTSLKECLKRNAKRDNKVPEDLIINMALYFEEPIEEIECKDGGKVITIPKDIKKKVKLPWPLDNGNYYREQALKIAEGK
jgi:predicted kinase